MGLTAESQAAPCTEGEQQTSTCPDGSTLVLRVCSAGIWTDTGLTCPAAKDETNLLVWAALGGVGLLVLLAMFRRKEQPT